MSTLKEIKETSDNIKNLLNNPLENIVKITQLNNSLSILIDRLIREEESNEDSENSDEDINKKIPETVFTIPNHVSKPMAEFLCIPEDQPISRDKATRYIAKYIKEHNLCDPNNSRIIIPDEKLKTILCNFVEEKDILSYFNLQKYLAHNYITPTEKKNVLVAETFDRLNEVYN